VLHTTSAIQANGKTVVVQSAPLPNSWRGVNEQKDLNFALETLNDNQQHAWTTFASVRRFDEMDGADSRAAAGLLIHNVLAAIVGAAAAAQHDVASRRRTRCEAEEATKRRLRRQHLRRRPSLEACTGSLAAPSRVRVPVPRQGKEGTYPGFGSSTSSQECQGAGSGGLTVKGSGVSDEVNDKIQALVVWCAASWLAVWGSPLRGGHAHG
jgi:hypothetical protein